MWFWHRNRKIFHIAKQCDQISKKRKLALKFNILILFFYLITWHRWFFPKLLMKTNNLKWGIEFKIWHIYPLIWKSRLLLNPFWSVFTCFFHLLTILCLLSNINEIPATVVCVITGMWENSDYTNSVAGEKSGQRANISLHVLNTHTPLLKKKKNPSSSGFLIIFYNLFPFNIQNIHMLFWGVKKAYLVHIQNFGKASFFSHIWSGWYWKICFLWGSCSFSTYFFLIVKCGLKGHFKSQWQNFLQLWNCL